MPRKASKGGAARGHRNMYWLLLMAVVGLLVVYAEHRNLYGRFLDFLASEEQVNEIHHKKQDVEKQVQELEQRHVDLVSNPLEKEAESRRNKNLVRPDETVYRILQNPSGPDNNSG